MARHGAYAGFLAALAASVVASGCCSRRAAAVGISSISVERRDTTIYRPGYRLENSLYLPESGPDSVFTRTVRDSATGAALAITYQPATRTVYASVERPPDTVYVPRTLERITYRTNKTPFWQRLTDAGFGALLALVVVGLVRAFR